MGGPILYWLLVILGTVVGGWVLLVICSVLDKLIEGAPVGISAGEAARVLLDRAGITDVAVVEMEAKGRDSFAAASRQVRLKPSTYQARRVGGLAFAAHEVGHVVHAVRYPRLPAWRERAARPVARLILLTGLLLVAARLLDWPVLSALGVVGYGILTLLVALKWVEELDASRRGIRLLSEAGLLPPGGQRTAVVKLLLAFGTYLGVTGVFLVLYGFLLVG